MSVTTSNKKSIGIVAGILAAIGISLFAYLMWYMAPAEVTEMVRVVAVTDDGCIAETMDGFAVNIGPCDANPDELIMATYDAKVKERAALMNPTK